MGTWKRWLALVIAAAALSACSEAEQEYADPAINDAVVLPDPVPAGPMMVADAVESGAVHMTVTGSNLTEITVSLTADRDVQVTLPVGTLMVSNDSASQNMMTARTREVHLHGTPETPDTQTLTIPAYCVNFHLDVPTGSTGFTLAAAGEDRPELRALAECLENRNVDHETKQRVIWAISDSFAQMTIEQYVDDKLQRARAAIAALSPDQAADWIQREIPDADPTLVARLRTLPPDDVARLLTSVTGETERAAAVAEFSDLRATVRPLLEQCNYDIASLPMFAGTEPEANFIGM